MSSFPVLIHSVCFSHLIAWARPSLSMWKGNNESQQMRVSFSEEVGLGLQRKAVNVSP